MRTKTLHLGRLSALITRLKDQPDFDINAADADDDSHYCLPHLEPWLPGTWNFGYPRFPITLSDGCDPNRIEFADVCFNPGESTRWLVNARASEADSLTKGCLLWIGNPNDPDALYTCSSAERSLLFSQMSDAPSKCPFFYEKNTLWALPFGAKLVINYTPATVRNTKLVPSWFKRPVPLYVITVTNDGCALSLAPESKTLLPVQRLVTV